MMLVVILTCLHSMNEIGGIYEAKVIMTLMIYYVGAHKLELANVGFFNEERSLEGRKDVDVLSIRAPRSSDTDDGDDDDDNTLATRTHKRCNSSYDTI